MRTLDSLERAVLLALVVCAAGVSIVSTRGLAAPASAPSATSSARPAAVAAPVELASLTVPVDKTPRPKGAEWADARPVRTSRRTRAARTCSALLLREYLKVTCSMGLAGVRQFAGPIEDVAVWVSPATTFQTLFGTESRGGSVVFPLRRGSGHVFRFFGAESAYDGGIYPNDGPLVDAYWPAGDASPTVTIR